MAAESKILPIIEGFTQEPWKALALGVSCPSERVTLKSGREVPRQIAVVKDHEGQIPQDRLYADGELIAAAPKLYRIAHEQRALIEKLVASLKESRTAMGYAHDESEDFRHAENRNACPCEMAAIFRRAGEALAAAAPFLED